MGHPKVLNCIEDRNSDFDQSIYGKEIIKMWSDITENNIESINRNLNKNLMKDIAEKEDHLEDIKYIMYSKQMWDSEKSEWVPFNLWGAYLIFNKRKEYVVLRIYAPCDIQPEFGPTIKGWRFLDSSYLNEILEKGYKDFYVIIKQDREEYERESRINEYPNKIR